MTRLNIPSMPYAGPCACCGGPGKRHRVCDRIRERYKHKELVHTIYADYGIFSFAEVRALCEASPQAYGGWLRRTRP